MINRKTKEGMAQINQMLLEIAPRYGAKIDNIRWAFREKNDEGTILFISLNGDEKIELEFKKDMIDKISDSIIDYDKAIGIIEESLKKWQDNKLVVICV